MTKQITSNDIFNMAHTDVNKKLTKQEAFNEFLKLIDHLKLTEDDYSTVMSCTNIIRTLIPPAPAKPKSIRQWLAKFAAKKDIRKSLNYVYSDGKNTVATNSHILAVEYNSNIEPGFYDPKTLIKIKVDDNFPDYNIVIPDAKDMLPINFDINNIEDIKSINEDNTPIVKIGGTWYNLNYIKLMQLYNNEGSWYQTESQDKLMYRFDNCLVVCMPICNVK